MGLVQLYQDINVPSILLRVFDNYTNQVTINGWNNKMIGTTFTQNGSNYVVVSVR